MSEAPPPPSARPWPLRILGTGIALPAQRIASTTFDERFRRPAGTTERATGIRSRCVAGPDETAIRLGARAATEALLAANLLADRLDCLLSASSVMHQAIPCLGAQIQRELGLGKSGIPAFDVNATCLGFVVALQVAAGMLAGGDRHHVLIVSSEIASAGVHPNDPVTAPMFGDGAAAVVVGRADGPNDSASALLAIDFATFGDDADLCQVRAGGSGMRVHDDPQRYAEAAWFTMDGPALYRRTARLLPPFFTRLLASAGIAVADLECIVPHQASGKALDHMTSALELPAERVIRTLPELGNQIAASVPTALHTAITTGRLRRGQLCALLGTGAGLSLGGAVLRF
jgi:3-oxoacyl-[acyl-carrier-protein] synthase III